MPPLELKNNNYPVFLNISFHFYFNSVFLKQLILHLQPHRWRFIKNIVAPVANVLVIGPLSQSLQNDVAVVEGNHK